MITHDDIELLMRALDALDAKSSSDGFTSALLSTMLAKDKESAKKHLDDYQQREKAKEYDLRRLKDQTTLLRAKLISIRQGLDSESADRILSDARNNS